MDVLATQIAEGIAAGRWGAGAPLPAVRETSARTGRSPRSVVRAHAELADAGLIELRDRARARVVGSGPALARRLLRGGRPLRLAGSDDPALDLVLRSAGASVDLVPGPRGSVGGLERLARGTADAAVIHLLHVASGRHNDPFVRRLLPGEDMVLVHLWRREQGLVVARGNPHRIEGAQDLAGLRLAWRPAGSGSWLTLRRLLDEHGVSPAPEGARADSHLAVAAAVAAGAADAGLAVRAAAVALDLGFVPVAVEPFELAVRQDALPAAQELVEALSDRRLRNCISTLGGYDLADAGALRVAA